jgi:hypothetical protein
MYVFVKQVCAMYHRLNTDPELHIRRVDMVTSAVNAIFAEGVADELPFGGDLENAVNNVLPCVQDVFQMPTMRPKKGTKEWVQFMFSHLEECSFDDLVENETLAKYYWKHHIKKDKTGRPRLLNSDVLVWSTYAPQKPKGKTMLSPRTLTPHNYFTFLRGVPHNRGITGARNAGGFPVLVKAEEPSNLSNKVCVHESSCVNECVLMQNACVPMHDWVCVLKLKYMCPHE